MTVQVSFKACSVEQELTFSDLLIAPWLDAQMAQLAQGEVEVDAAVPVVEPGNTKAKKKKSRKAQD